MSGERIATPASGSSSLVTAWSSTTESGGHDEPATLANPLCALRRQSLWQSDATADAAPIDVAAEKAVFGHWAEPNPFPHDGATRESPVAAAHADNGAADRAERVSQPGWPGIETADDLNTMEPPLLQDAWTPIHRALPNSAASLETAEAGFQGGSQALPHQAKLQAAFGPGHDLSRISAFVGGSANQAAAVFGARAYAAGNRIGFRSAPDLHLSAHEAAHVVLGHQGVRLKRDVDATEDADERKADEVADRVVRGESAADLLPSAEGAPAPDGTQPPEQANSTTDPEVQKPPRPEEQPSGDAQPSVESPATKPDGAGASPRVASRAQGPLSPQEAQRATKIFGRGLHYDIWIAEAEELLALVSEADLQESGQLLGPQLVGQALQLRSAVRRELQSFNAALRAVIALPEGQTLPGERLVKEAMSRLHSIEVDYRNFLRTNNVENKLRCNKAIATEKTHGLIAGWQLVGLSLKHAELKLHIKKVGAELSEIERLIEENLSAPVEAGVTMVVKTAGSLALGILKKWKKSLKWIITLGKIALDENPAKETAKEAGTEAFEKGVEHAARSKGVGESTAKTLGEYGGQILDFLIDFNENWEEFTNELDKFQQTNQKLLTASSKLFRLRLILIDKMQDCHTELRKVIEGYAQTFDGARTECTGVEGSYQDNRSRVQVPGLDN